jgi:hypothetical protein
MNIFYSYENLAKRQEQIDRYRLKEGIKVKMEYDPAITVLTFKNVPQYYTVKSVIPSPPVAVPEPPKPAVVEAPAVAPTTPLLGRQSTRRATTASSRSEQQTQQEDSDFDSSDDEAISGRRGSGSGSSTRLAAKRASAPKVEEAASAGPAAPAVRVLDSWDEVEALGGPAKHLVENGELLFLA